MPLTPLDIQKKEFKRGLRGYDPDQVDDFLDLVLKDYEALYKKNFELEDEIRNLEEELARYKKLEDTLHNTMVLAQKTAEEVRVNAEREAELIFREAKAKAEGLNREAEEQIQKARQDYEAMVSRAHQFRAKFKAFLTAQLEMIDGDNGGDHPLPQGEPLAEEPLLAAKKDDEEFWG